MIINFIPSIDDLTIKWLILRFQKETHLIFSATEDLIKSHLVQI